MKPFLTPLLRSTVVLLLSLIGASGVQAQEAVLIREGKQVSVPETSTYRKRIEMGTAVQKSLPHYQTIPGVIEVDPAASVSVLPALTGRLVDMKVSLGDTVRSGQLLASIQSSDLLQVGADVQKARDAFHLAQTALERTKQVFSGGGNSQKDVDQAQSAFEQARSEMERSELRLKVYELPAQVDLSKLSLPVKAPISGTLSSVNVGTNAVVNDLTASLMTVTNLDSVFLTLLVPENLLSQIKVGQTLSATTAAWPDQVLQAKVQSIGAILDPDTRRVKVRALVDNPKHHLLPNMFASVKFNVPQPPQVVVPLSAVIMSNDKNLVFVQTKPWTFEPRVVQLGQEDKGEVRVVSGLNAGDKIVVRGGVLLND